MARPRLPVGAHGSINLDQIEKGKWRARTLYRFDDGKRRQVERFARTSAAAQNSLLNALTTIETPSSTSGTMTKGMSMKELANAFLEVKRAGKLSPNTMRAYEQHVTQLIVPMLGALSVSEVKSMRVQAFVNEVIKESGPGSASGARGVLSGMFGLALRNDVIAVNPVRGIERISKPSNRGANALQPESILEMIRKVRATKDLVERDFGDLWEFMSLTGCRIGEACALTFALVSEDEGSVQLGPSVAQAKGGKPFIYEDAKTEASMRTIIVPKRAIDIVKARRGEVAHTDDDAVFPDPLGKLYTPKKLQDLWRDHREKLGYPDFTSHGFRKTVATSLDDADLTARDIADYLGHSRPSMTQDVYIKRKNNSVKAAKAVSAMFGVSSG